MAKSRRARTTRARSRTHARAIVKKRVAKERIVKKRAVKAHRRTTRSRGMSRHPEAPGAQAPGLEGSVSQRSFEARAQSALASQDDGEPAGAPAQIRWRKFDWDDELTEDVRQRYEETNESIASIAAAVEMSGTQLRRKIEAYGWLRPQPVKRGLSPASKLAKQADALLQARPEEGPPPLTRAELRPAAEALLRTAQAHAAELEALQKQKSAAGQTARDTHSLTGSIATMAATVGKLAQLCAPETQRNSNGDQSCDLDEVREALAQRIEALVAEWRAAEAAEGSAGPDGAAGG